VVVRRDATALDGRVAVVTGAAAGIGRATALALATHGADIAAIDRDESGLASLAAEVVAAGRRCVTSVGDVREAAAIADFVARTTEALGDRVHVLVNNVGGGFRAAFADLSPRGDETLVRENLLSVVWVTRAFLPLLADGASVVNVTSIEAHRAAPGFSLYAAAKAGVAELTQSLALELGVRSIRVNAVAPDVIQTPGIGTLQPPARTPLGRFGEPDEVAGVVVFLAGGLSSFVTGATVLVDGGNLAAAGWRRDDTGEGWVT